MVQIDSCYQDDGDLAAALEEAAAIVRRIGQQRVMHVIARQQEEIGAWWVDVIYLEYPLCVTVTGIAMPKEWTNP